MCFNANLERQFEFVQQTWVDSRVFHDGRDAPDPLISHKREGDQFIIPRSTGALDLDLYQEEQSSSGKGQDNAPATAVNFTSTIGGGYFFMPSKQALTYLSHLPSSESTSLP